MIAPVIDGQLNDVCWRSAQRISSFDQWRPSQEHNASQKTTAFLTYDRHYLYFAAVCLDSNQPGVRANVSARDEMFTDDWILLVIDTHNRRNFAYEFAINPLGIQGDLINSGNSDDKRWDAIWQSVGFVTDSGWQVEAAIPFSCLRFPNSENQLWRVQVVRKIARDNEMDTYVPIRKIDNVFLTRTAELRGISYVNCAPLFDITPYFSQRLDKTKESRWKSSTGCDLKAVITSNLVLDATAHPDYGQVEADLDQINLTPYELYLTEKRPFFLERMEIFESPLDLFYSRRISDPNTGCKLTGKVGKFAIGALYAGNDSTAISKNVQMSATRIQVDILRQSLIGALFTDKEIYSHHNRVFAGDWKIVQGSLSIVGQLARSCTDSFSDPAWTGIGVLDYARNDWDINYAFRFLESGFISEMGFVTPLYRGLDFIPISYRKHNLTVVHNWQLESQILKKISIATSLSETEPYAKNQTLSQYASVEMSSIFAHSVSATVGFDAEKKLWQDSQNHLHEFYAAFSASPINICDASLYYSRGMSLDYWAIGTVLQNYLLLSFDFRPSHALDLAPSFSYVAEEKGAVSPSTPHQWVGALQATYNCSSKLFLRIFCQRDSEARQLQTNALIGYTFMPGSTFYLAYNGTLSDYAGTKLKKQSDVLFTKITYYIHL